MQTHVKKVEVNNFSKDYGNEIIFGHTITISYFTENGLNEVKNLNGDTKMVNKKRNQHKVWTNFVQY